MVGGQQQSSSSQAPLSPACIPHLTGLQLIPYGLLRTHHTPAPTCTVSLGDCLLQADTFIAERYSLFACPVYLLELSPCALLALVCATCPCCLSRPCRQHTL